MKRNDPKEPKEAEAKWDGVINPQNYNFNQFNTENFDALKRYKSTEVDRRTWLHVPSGTLWSTSSDTHQVVEIYKETSTKMDTPFESGLINNMDHMSISGTAPS